MESQINWVSPAVQMQYVKLCIDSLPRINGSNILIIVLHKNIVKSATHTHFGDRCAEWVILEGDNDSIKQFVERISAIKYDPSLTT